MHHNQQSIWEGSELYKNAVEQVDRACKIGHLDRNITERVKQVAEVERRRPGRARGQEAQRREGEAERHQHADPDQAPHQAAARYSASSRRARV